MIGGESASIAKFPFMARVFDREGTSSSLCSGTVVSPNMVLTAAHCLLNEAETAFRAPEGFRVATGSSSVTSSGVVSSAQRLVIDPNYVASGPWAHWHDAGLIQLSSPIAAPTVHLATTQIWEPGTQGFVVGWGLTEAEGSPAIDMQLGETVVQSTAYCQSAVGLQFHPLAELCTLDYPSYESATCHGDSGGPLLMVPGNEFVQIGITSFGIEEGCPTDSPRVDTRIDGEAGWIQREIAAHPPPEPPTPSPSVPEAPNASPTPDLARLTISLAKRETLNVLRTDRSARLRFRTHSQYRISCRSVAAVSVRCGVNWYRRPNDYWGTVTIFLTREGKESVWDYRYTIHSVNDWCYWYSGHRPRCPIGTIRR
ncbi:MAG TPA: serine protease [Solirubrobacterales bacterium]|nr:serine protease [Solirubrobacterales bacterium]